MSNVRVLEPTTRVAPDPVRLPHQADPNRVRYTLGNDDGARFARGCAFGLFFSIVGWAIILGLGALVDALVR